MGENNMWWLFFILLFLISVVSSTLLFYSLRRINQYENLILEFQQIITFASERMKQVDANGHYESDDETGFFFKQLKDLQLLLGEIFETEEMENAKKEK
jgi:biopolymer transport protein ExbB/TolQ